MENTAKSTHQSTHQLVTIHNIKSLRRLRGYSQAGLGKAIGRDRMFIANIERRGNVSREYLGKIASVLGVSSPSRLLKDKLDIKLGEEPIDFS